MIQEDKEKLLEAARNLYRKQLDIKNLGCAQMPIDGSEAIEQFANYQLMLAELKDMQIEYDAMLADMMEKKRHALQPPA